jgi:hypothetical protein
MLNRAPHVNSFIEQADENLLQATHGAPKYRRAGFPATSRGVSLLNEWRA